ncbi:MAG: nickel-dependent lactate racemase [Acidobacteriota bacterium]|nr:nickel-dependent lactate racemase [Acidobacteriota bacterium]
MPYIELKYGKSNISFDYDETLYQVLGNQFDKTALTDRELGEQFEKPTASPPLEEIVNQGETVLIVVPDATRQTASGQVVNLLVRRLIANGTMPHDIRIIFATGIHRQVTEDEKKDLLTPFIYQRIKTLDHQPRDLANLVRLGETADGIPIELNRALVEHDKIIIVGGISFHYFAGFTGGRKLICPGLASSRTIAATHKLAFDCATKSRREGVDTGILDGNAVHEAFMRVVEKLPPSFAVNTIVNERGEATDLFVGDWIASHHAACEFFAAENTVEISEKRDIVIVSGGGNPHDVNMIQAHKALDAASRACTDGGTIILLAECAEGLGRKDFLDWFEAENSARLAEKLCESYQVNGQTAWNLLRIAEKFDVKIITLLTENETRPMRLQKARSIDECLAESDAVRTGYVLPFGAKIRIID